MTELSAAAEPLFIAVGTGDAMRTIAMRIRPAQPGHSGPALLWLSGYRSDMSGTKAIEMDGLAERLGLASIRFDYSGHGLSGGAFTDGTISRWLEEALAVVDHVRADSLLVVGSSMGGWIALRLIEELRKRPTPTAVAGLVLIAPAPDFTSVLIEPNLSEVEKLSLSERGFFEERSQYSLEPNVFTRALIEDGRDNQVLAGIIDTGCPVHILQGMQDDDVPYAHALRLIEHLPSDDVVLTLIRDGDHRLSRPQDIERMLDAIAALTGAA